MRVSVGAAERGVAGGKDGGDGMETGGVGVGVSRCPHHQSARRTVICW